MSRLRLITLAVLACAALTLAACDGDTEEKNDYVDQVNSVVEGLADDVTAIPTAASGGEHASAESPQQLSASLDSLSQEIDDAVNELDGITPPEQVAGLHDKIVSSLQTFADEAKGAANEIAAGGAAAIAGIATQFIGEATRINNEIQSTFDEINQELQE